MNTQHTHTEWKTPGEHLIQNDKSISIFEPMASWFNKASEQWIRDKIELVRDSKGVILKSSNDVMSWFVGSLAPDIRQQYQCNTCGKFLNGIGSLIFVHAESYQLEPFALPPVDDATPIQWVEIYTKLRQKLITEKSNIIVPHAGQDRSAWYGHFDNMCADKGYFTHLHAGVPTIELESILKEVLIDPVDHGVGDAEIKATSEWLNIVKSVDLRGITKDDVKPGDYAILDGLRTIKAALASGVDQSIFVRYALAKNGLSLLLTKNYAVGNIVTNLHAGYELQSALNMYYAMIDTKKYKRPVRMPTEREFERSVEFIKSKGWDKYLPMRLASFDELELQWTKADTVPVEETQLKDIFGGLRKKIKPTQSAGVDKPKLAAKRVSMTKFIELIESVDDPVLSIKHLNNQAYYGSIAVPVEGIDSPIYKEGRVPVPFIYTDPRHVYQLYRDTSLTALPDRSADGLIYRKDVNGRIASAVLVYKDVSWKTNIATPIFPDLLINDLHQHRRVIEHYGQNTYMNVDENGELITFENTLLIISLSMLVEYQLEFKDSIRNYTITAAE